MPADSLIKWQLYPIACELYELDGIFKILNNFN